MWLFAVVRIQSCCLPSPPSALFVEEIRLALFSFELSDGRGKTPGRRPYLCDHVAVPFLWHNHHYFGLGGRSLLARSWSMNPLKAAITVSQIRFSVFSRVPIVSGHRPMTRPVSTCFQSSQYQSAPVCQLFGLIWYKSFAMFPLIPSHLPRLWSSPPSLTPQHGPQHSDCHPLRNKLRARPGQHHPRPRG